MKRKEKKRKKKLLNNGKEPYKIYIPDSFY